MIRRAHITHVGPSGHSIVNNRLPLKGNSGAMPLPSFARQAIVAMHPLNGVLRKFG
ncbi:MAG: hypothetical protein V7632_5214 [Bradyrhizobium sp.]|jgi:hypothetical protein